MNASIRLGTVRGIELGIHYSWFIVLIVFSFIFAREQYPSMYEGWSETAYWVVGIASVLLLFVSVVIHEFGHALTAQAKGIGVRSITLWIFGGVALLDQDSEEPGDEFQIAIAGPLASLGLAALFGGLWWLVGDASEQLAVLLGYLSLVNVILAVFNMIPGFPLDGGRVLRAIIWKVTGNIRRATRIVTILGSLIGTGFFFLGILSAIEGSLVNGIWYIALGWFLQNAAEQGYHDVQQRELLRGVTVRDIVDFQPPTVPLTITVEELVRDYVLRQNVRGAPVINNGRLFGIVTLTDVKEVPTDRWPATFVRDILTPLNQLHTVTLDTSIADALSLMTAHELNQIPVVALGRPDELVGLLRRADFIRYLQLRQELGLTSQSRAPSSATRQPAPGD